MHKYFHVKCFKESQIISCADVPSLIRKTKLKMSFLKVNVRVASDMIDDEDEYALYKHHFDKMHKEWIAYSDFLSELNDFFCFHGFHEVFYYTKE
jgi:hypothetical protein